jgi:hypothetical protein
MRDHLEQTKRRRFPGTERSPNPTQAKVTHYLDDTRRPFALALHLGQIAEAN